ncbi:MAG: hypothetical protein H6584_04555 [Flavobacteriales bacterium]|nr:hypothetical protein [Flavobacteriales bacterium]
MSTWTKTLIVAFLATACQSYKPESVVQKEEGITTTFSNTYFSDSQTDYVYKSNIKVYGHDLSGLMIIKKTSDVTHRLVFTTEFGNKLLDLEFSKGEMIVNYVVEELNKKILLNTLKKDFLVLLQQDFVINTNYVSATHCIYESSLGKQRLFFKEAKTDKVLAQILKTSRYKEKVSYNFQSKSSIFADRIWIEHYDMKLTYEFNYIGQPKP